MLPWWAVVIAAAAAEAPEVARGALRERLAPKVRAARRRSAQARAQGKDLQARREWEILRSQLQRERDEGVHAITSADVSPRQVLDSAPFLYHVTSSRLHPIVRAHGLHPAPHSGRLFLSTWEGLPMWVPWRMIEEVHRGRRSDDPLPPHDEWMRVYRVPTHRVTILGVDSLGTEDAAWTYARNPVEGFPWPLAARVLAVVTDRVIPPEDLSTARARMVTLDPPQRRQERLLGAPRRLEWDGDFRPVR